MKLWIDFHPICIDTLFEGEKEYYDFDGIEFIFMVTQILCNFKF